MSQITFTANDAYVQQMLDYIALSHPIPNDPETGEPEYSKLINFRQVMIAYAKGEALAGQKISEAQARVSMPDDILT